MNSSFKISFVRSFAINLKYIYLFSLLIISPTLIGQIINTKKIDSLTSVLVKKNKTQLDKTIIYNLLAEEYQGLEPDKSFEFLNKALPISKKNNYNKGIADYYRISAKNYLNQGQYKKTLNNADKALKIYLKTKDTLNYLKTLPYLVRAINETGNNEKAISICLKGIQLSNNNKFNYEFGNLYYELCFFYNIKDDISKALFYLNKAESCFSLTSQKLNGFLKCYQQRSQIYTKTNQHQKAIKYAEKSLQTALKLKLHKNILSIIYTTLGIAYFNFDDNIQAIKYLKIANEIYKVNGIIDRRAFNLAMLAEAYFGLKKYNMAIILAKEAIASIDDNEISLMAYGIIGSSYYKMKNYPLALSNQKNALKLIDFVEDIDHQRSIYLDISKTYSKLGDFKNAYKNLDKYKDLEINFLRNIQDKNINELEIKFDSKQKDLDLKELTIIKQQQNLEILKHKNFNIILFSLIIFFFVITAIIIFALLNNKKKNKLLNIKNKIILEKITLVEDQKVELSQSLNEKNILLKEVHHRVKNNLQLVMSLLNFQASYKENTSIEEFVKKGRARIATMVLIHENLYQREDFGNIEFKTFTTTLVNNIKTTFGEVSDKITIKIKIANIFFDIQTSIPLGLIINELVTNSFKYGFPNGKTGQITISIEHISDVNYKLVIEDTGVGFTKDKIEKKSIGLELVSLLVLQLKGKLTINSKNGTAFEIIFAPK
jgi:two-component sensor histidine kinase